MTTKPAHVLVVDDHPTNRLKMSMAVQNLGHAARAVEDGRQALALLRLERHDLVLLDLLMPELDGYQVLQAMKQDAELRNIPVIVISSVDEMDSVVKAIELGAEDYLPKTFDPVLLRARVNACLEKKRLRDLEVEYLAQVAELTRAAAAVEAEDFDPGSLDLATLGTRGDELGVLARVFERMAREIYARQAHLKKRVIELEVQIDEARQERQVRRITGTTYFQDLRGRAGQFRETLQSDEADRSAAVPSNGRRSIG